MWGVLGVDRFIGCYQGFPKIILLDWILPVLKNTIMSYHCVFSVPIDVLLVVAAYCQETTEATRTRSQKQQKKTQETTEPRRRHNAQKAGFQSHKSIQKPQSQTGKQKTNPKNYPGKRPQTGWGSGTWTSVP